MVLFPVQWSAIAALFDIILLLTCAGVGIFLVFKYATHRAVRMVEKEADLQIERFRDLERRVSCGMQNGHWDRKLLNFRGSEDANTNSNAQQLLGGGAVDSLDQIFGSEASSVPSEISCPEPALSRPSDELPVPKSQSFDSAFGEENSFNRSPLSSEKQQRRTYVASDVRQAVNLVLMPKLIKHQQNLSHYKAKLRRSEISVQEMRTLTRASANHFDLLYQDATLAATALCNTLGHIPLRRLVSSDASWAAAQTHARMVNKSLPDDADYDPDSKCISGHSQDACLQTRTVPTMRRERL